MLHKRHKGSDLRSITSISIIATMLVQSPSICKGTTFRKVIGSTLILIVEEYFMIATKSCICNMIATEVALYGSNFIGIELTLLILSFANGINNHNYWCRPETCINTVQPVAFCKTLSKFGETLLYTRHLWGQCCCYLEAEVALMQQFVT